jgi:prepilin-type N-terminal cleavage/methylation domain-containing protein
MRKNQKGFSLVELLVVVAVILIIAAIAIPRLTQSRMSANEASAVASLRTINSSEVVYSSTYSVPTVFSADLTSLSDGGTPANCALGVTPTSAHACLIDAALAAATAAPGKSGYTFTYAPAAGNYTLTAAPITLDSTGVHYFFTDQTVVIRTNAGAPATASSTPIW